jgi:DNA-directed RNA polymerase subunit RPC12/RpoP
MLETKSVHDSDNVKRAKPYMKELDCLIGIGALYREANANTLSIGEVNPAKNNRRFDYFKDSYRCKKCGKTERARDIDMKDFGMFEGMYRAGKQEHLCMRCWENEQRERK